MNHSNKTEKSFKLLAVETATSEVGAAIISGGRQLLALTHRTSDHHVEELFLMIDQLLADSGSDLSEMDAFAVDVGPGLFTGLRVGIAAAKTLAYGLGKTVVPVSGTEVLSKALERKVIDDCADDSSVCGRLVLSVPVLDVRRGEVAFVINSPFLCCPPGQISSGEINSFDHLDAFSVSKDSHTVGLQPHLEETLGIGIIRLATPEHFSKLLAEVISAIFASKSSGAVSDATDVEYLRDWQLVLAGGGASRYRSQIRQALDAAFGELGDHLVFYEDMDAAPVGILGEVAYREFCRGLALEPSMVKPIYLREADAKAGAWKGAVTKET